MIMKKQIEKNEASLKKVAKGIERVFNGEFQNWELILKLLYKREIILEKTRKKLVKMNKKHLISWENPVNSFIS